MKKMGDHLHRKVVPNSALTETPRHRIVRPFQDRDRPEYRYGRESVHDHAQVSNAGAAGAFV